ncbi:U-box domain-containing protein 35-like [Trifolium pratense]|uniref:U-box domain-containing protein 35-like n=1 Tax=Trifolium pratense TaxID=57577 RepID=A0A2K3KTQ6_TRIPR|nr:U-box domain-containing protein 35-like [Trifolium pratense]
MWKGSRKGGGAGGGGGGGNGLVAVAIDKDKGSQYALKWAADNLLTRGQTVILIHVSQVAGTTSSSSSKSACISRNKTMHVFFTPSL